LACGIALVMGAAATAQDSTIESRTEIKTDDAKVFSMTGCLERNAAGNFTLRGTAVKSREGITTETRVETETDRDEEKVTATTRTRAEDGRVGTAGSISTFMLTPREGVALSQYVGQQVQLSAIVLDPDEKDAEVKIEDKVRVDPDRGDSSSKRTRTEVEIERGTEGHYTVMTVKPLGGPCQ
jgi:hypothetical protein